MLMAYTLLMAKKHALDEQLHHDNSQLVWHVLFKNLNFKPHIFPDVVLNLPRGQHD